MRSIFINVTSRKKVLWSYRDVSGWEAVKWQWIKDLPRSTQRCAAPRRSTWIHPPTLPHLLLLCPGVVQYCGPHPQRTVVVSGCKYTFFDLSNVVACGHNKLWWFLVTIVWFRITNWANMFKKINNSFNYVNTFSPGNLSEFFVIYSISCGRIATHFLWHIQ